MSGAGNFNTQTTLLIFFKENLTSAEEKCIYNQFRIFKNINKYSIHDRTKVGFKNIKI